MIKHNTGHSWQDQGEMFNVASPCINICTSNSKGFCKGCLRSRTERFHWHEMTDNQKFTVVKLCQTRRARIQAARNKRDLKHLEQKDLFNRPDIQITLF